MKNTIVGVDLAKHVIQVCVVTNNKVISNEEIAAHDFTAWLAKMKPSSVIFEACGTSNYWKQIAVELGHDARLISANLVSKIRQNQKTDKNDALAIAQAMATCQHQLYSRQNLSTARTSIDYENERTCC